MLRLHRRVVSQFAHALGHDHVAALHAGSDNNQILYPVRNVDRCLYGEGIALNTVYIDAALLFKCGGFRYNRYVVVGFWYPDVATVAICQDPIWIWKRCAEAHRARACVYLTRYRFNFTFLLIQLTIYEHKVNGRKIIDLL